MSLRVAITALSLALLSSTGVGAQERVVMPDRHNIEMGAQLSAMKTALQSLIKNMNDKVEEQGKTIETLDDTVVEQQKEIEELRALLANLGAGGETGPSMSDAINRIKGKSFSCDSKQIGRSMKDSAWKHWKARVKIGKDGSVYTSACVYENNCSDYVKSHTALKEDTRYDRWEETTTKRWTSSAQFSIDYDTSADEYKAYLKGDFYAWRKGGSAGPQSSKGTCKIELK